MRRQTIATVILCGFFFVADKPATANEVEFFTANLNEHQFFIPTAYDQGSVIKPEIEVQLIQLGVIYPSFLPSDKMRRELIADKNMKDYVHITVYPLKSDHTFREFVEHKLKDPQPTLTEKKYGLYKVSEPYEDFQQRADRWLERRDGKALSIISCTTKVYDAKGTSSLQVEPKDYPCSLSFFSDGIWYQVKFSNRRLENWKKIQSETLNLFESFESEDAAVKYLEENQK